MDLHEKHYGQKQCGGCEKWDTDYIVLESGIVLCGSCAHYAEEEIMGADAGEDEKTNWAKL